MPLPNNDVTKDITGDQEAGKLAFANLATQNIGVNSPTTALLQFPCLPILARPIVIQDIYIFVWFIHMYVVIQNINGKPSKSCVAGLDKEDGIFRW